MNIDEISQKFTKCLAQIWRVHPFRDGNTRTTLTFADIFAKQHGFEMDMGMLLDNLERIVDDETGKIKRFSVRDKFVLAALDEKDYPEPEHLERIIKMSIEKGINKKIDLLNQSSPSRIQCRIVSAVCTSIASPGTRIGIPGGYRYT